MPCIRPQARIAARQEELEEELVQKPSQEQGGLSEENSDGEGFQPLPTYRASTVPFVVWDTQEDAVAKLREAGLADPVIETQNDANVAAGKVISQSLDAGTEVDEGTQITIVVSGGPASFEMPIEIIINDYELFTDGFYYEWPNDDNSVSFIDFEKGGISGHFTFSRELTDEEKTGITEEKSLLQAERTVILMQDFSLQPEFLQQNFQNNCQRGNIYIFCI